MTRSICAFILSGLLAITATTVLANPLDLREDGAYCTASLKITAPSTHFTPAWKAPITIPSDALGVLTADHLAHNLNSEYLRNMVDSTYFRLDAAKQAGLELRPYKEGFKQVAEYCSQPDLSGQSLKIEAAKLAHLPDEVDDDYRAFGLKVPAQDVYIRKVVIAALEARRIQRVIKAILFELKSTRQGSARADELDRFIAAHLRRLLRIQYRFPVLTSIGTFLGGESVEGQIESSFGAELSELTKPEGANFSSDPLLEETLALNPADQPPAELAVVELFGKATPEVGATTFYRDFYRSILKGNRPVAEFVKDRLLAALDLSVRESISSAMLKCQNKSPCAAITTNPLLAAAKIDRAGLSEELGPMACLCRIGTQHQWLSGVAGASIGAGSAAAILVATVFPVNWLVVLAYGLASADGVAALAAINDSYLNVNATNQVALLRAGGAVPPIYEFDMENDYANQRYNTFMSVATGLVSLVPPGKILARPMGVSAHDVAHSHEFLLQGKTEASKATAGLPPPELRPANYETSFDPRNHLASVSSLLRETNRPLAILLDHEANFRPGEAINDRHRRIAKVKEVAKAGR